MFRQIALVFNLLPSPELIFGPSSSSSSSSSSAINTFNDGIIEPAFKHHGHGHGHGHDDSPPKIADCIPGQSCFPSSKALHLFNSSVGGHLVVTHPPALPCYAGKDYNEAKCKQAHDGFVDPFWRADTLSSVQYTNWNGDGSVDTCPLPASSNITAVNNCLPGRTPSYLVDAHSIKDIQRAVQFAAKHRLRLRIRNTGHDYLGRSGDDKAFVISTHRLKESKIYKEHSWHPECGKYKSKKKGFFRRDDGLTDEDMALFEFEDDENASEDYSSVTCESSSSSSSSSGKSKCSKGPEELVLVGGPALYVADLYKFAHDNEVVAVGGVSRTVGATGGWSIGGGHGPLGRLFGMGVDNILQFKVVTADGRVVVANDCQNKDLFWALRGGGASFGVVVAVAYRVQHALKGVVGIFGQVTAETPEAHAAFLTKWLEAHRDFDAANITGYNYFHYPASIFAHLLPVAHNDQKSLQDREEDAEKAFEEITNWIDDRDDVSWKINYVAVDNWYNFWDGPFHEALSSLDAVGLNLLVSSRLVHKDVIYDDQKLEALSQTFANIHTPLIAHFVAGGAVAKPSRDATALHPAWRDSLLVIEPLVSWKNSDPPAVIQGTFSYLTNVTTQISKVAGHAAPGASYVNEANPNEPEGQWREVFWSTGHYDRLLKIKSKYDKKHLFNCYRCIGWNDSAKKKFPKIEIEI